MAGEPLSYWDYVKAAFWQPVRVRVLGAMPLSSMLLASFGLLGLFNAGFWLLGLAALVAFVGGRSASARFQKLVAAQWSAARASSTDDRLQSAYERLQPHSQARYRELVVLCREILGLGGAQSEASTSDFRAGNLNQMLWLFLRLLASREAITDTLARVDPAAVQAEVDALSARLAGAGDPEGALARSLKATLEIQNRRLANLETAKTNLAVAEAELERIEQQVRLVREESAVSRSPEALSARLDSVSTTLSETSRWADQHAELFSDLASVELDGSTVPSVPRLPQAPTDATPRASPPPPPPPPRQPQRQR
jgi:hypothetical protein